MADEGHYNLSIFAKNIVFEKLLNTLFHICVQKDRLHFLTVHFVRYYKYMIWITSQILAVNIKEWTSKQIWKVRCKIKFTLVVCSFPLVLVFKMLVALEEKIIRKNFSYHCNQKTWKRELTVKWREFSAILTSFRRYFRGLAACWEVRRVNYTCAKLILFTSRIYQYY